MSDWRIRSVGVIGERNVMFISTTPATSMMKVLLVEVYSKEV